MEKTRPGVEGVSIPPSGVPVSSSIIIIVPLTGLYLSTSCVPGGIDFFLQSMILIDMDMEAQRG